jgi:hypothetical protein
MSRLTKTIFIIGLTLLIYGYLCRILKIDFFWDSKVIGWIIFFIALLSYWVDLRRTRIQHGKRIILVTIGICILVFGLVLLPVVVFMLKTSDAYDAAIEYLKTDSNIKDEVGNVKGFGLIPTGSVQTTTINEVESGNAVFEIVVRGDKKYKDVTIELQKIPDSLWTVTYLK